MSGSNPSITVAILGDSKQLHKTTVDATDDVETMGRKMHDAGREAGKGFDTADERASAAERGFRGFSDTLGGTSDVMGGLKDGNLLQLGMGMADLFGAVQDLFLPLLTTMATKLGLVTVATEGQTVAQEANNVAMAANPIGIVVLALVALGVAFYIAWTKSETFRDIVTGVFDKITGVVTGVYDWVKDHWPLLLVILTGPFGAAFLAVTKYRDDVVGAITGIPGQLAGVAGDMLNKGREFGAALLNGVKAGISGFGQALVGSMTFQFDIATKIIDAVRDFMNTQIIDRFNRAVEFQIDLPFGRHFGVNPPDIPHLAMGGIVTRPTLAIIGEAGAEAVVPLSAGAGGRGGFGNTTIFNYPNGYRTPRQVVNAQRQYARTTGGVAA